MKLKEINQLIHKYTKRSVKTLKIKKAKLLNKV